MEPVALGGATRAVKDPFHLLSCADCTDITRSSEKIIHSNKAQRIILYQAERIGWSSEHGYPASPKRAFMHCLLMRYDPAVPCKSRPPVVW
jgi:hypothetical protein